MTLQCDPHCPDCLEGRYEVYGVPVLDKGFVRVEQVSMSDEMVVRAARVSFANTDTPAPDETEGLIRFLMKNRHGSPFEHNLLTLQVKMPIFVMREWVRHRIASFNEMSGRYTVLPEEWYVPAAEDVRRQVGKPGAYRYEPVDPEVAEHVRLKVDAAAGRSFREYHAMLDMGVAKEVARVVLPVNTYTLVYFTCNARSLMNFLSLRNAPDAQREIRKYAEAIEEMFQHYMPLTAAAFEEFGRKAP